MGATYPAGRAQVAQKESALHSHYLPPLKPSLQNQASPLTVSKIESRVTSNNAEC